MKTIQKRLSNGTIAKGNGKTHGMSNSREYDCWVAMKARCTKAKHPMYKLYGGRGITVCDRWLNSFESFYQDMGDSKGLTLDRIDVNGNYEPNNCRWITHIEQQANRRDNCQYVGVNLDPKYKHSKVKKWRAEIRRAGRKYYLGLFDSPEEASIVRESKRIELDGLCRNYSS